MWVGDCNALFSANVATFPGPKNYPGFAGESSAISQVLLVQNVPVSVTFDINHTDVF